MILSNQDATVRVLSFIAVVSAMAAKSGEEKTEEVQKPKTCYGPVAPETKHNVTSCFEAHDVKVGQRVG